MPERLKLTVHQTNEKDFSELNEKLKVYDGIPQAECPNCKVLSPLTETKCPNCGLEFEEETK